MRRNEIHQVPNKIFLFPFYLFNNLHGLPIFRIVYTIQYYATYFFRTIQIPISFNNKNCCITSINSVQFTCTKYVFFSKCHNIGIKRIHVQIKEYVSQLPISLNIKKLSQYFNTFRLIEMQ